MKHKDKKILFLVMGCNAPQFKTQYDVIKETWAKGIIDGKYGNNVDFLIYDGWENEHKLDKENKILHVRCEDDLDNTFKKTYYTLKLIQKKYDFDYVFRTNTTTYINIPLILKLIDYIEDNNLQDILWTPELLSLVEAAVPFPLDIYARGNGLLISKFYINILLRNGISHLYDEHVDDVLMGNVWNTYWILNGVNPVTKIKGIPHAWFRCVEKFDGSNNHQLCEYYNERSDWEFLKNFVTIQIKQYYHRSDEIENYKLLHKSIGDKIDNNLDETFDKLLKYSENPDVFIGSILGYIPLSTRLHTDANKLWTIECANKATNDPHRDKFLNKIWY